MNRPIMIDYHCPRIELTVDEYVGGLRKKNTSMIPISPQNIQELRAVADAMAEYLSQNFSITEYQP